MKVLREIMTEEVDTCSPMDNMYEAALKMKEKNVGAIPICEERTLIGMITDRDIVVRGVAEKRPNSSPIHEVMSDQLLTAEPDMDVHEAGKQMAEKQIRRLPVVEGEQLVGIVSLGDLAVHTTTEHDAGIALSEISERPEFHH